MDTKSLQQKINYKFNDIQLLNLALTHPSVQVSDLIKMNVKYDKDDSLNSYQRLEFLGDAFLQLIVTKKLINDYPNEDEGELSKMRSDIVRKENLAKAARKLELKKLVILGNSLDHKRQELKAKPLSDLVESLIGAIFLDSKNIDIAFEVVENLIKKFIWNPTNNIDKAISSKSKLNELLQKKHQESEYIIADHLSENNEHKFIVDIVINGKKIASGKGPSKKSAEEEAANKALKAKF